MQLLKTNDSDNLVPSFIREGGIFIYLDIISSKHVDSSIN